MRWEKRRWGKKVHSAIRCSAHQFIIGLSLCTMIIHSTSVIKFLRSYVWPLRGLAPVPVPALSHVFAMSACENVRAWMSVFLVVHDRDGEGGGGVWTERAHNFLMLTTSSSVPPPSRLFAPTTNGTARHSMIKYNVRARQLHSPNTHTDTPARTRHRYTEQRQPGV